MLKPLTKAKSTLKDTIFDSLMHGVKEQYVMPNLMTAKPLVSRSQPHSLQGEPHHTNTYQPHHQRQTKANYVAWGHFTSKCFIWTYQHIHEEGLCNLPYSRPTCYFGSFHFKSTSIEATNTKRKKACASCLAQWFMAIFMLIVYTWIWKSALQTSMCIM